MDFAEMKKLLESLKPTNEQIKALEAFFAAYTEEVRKDERAKQTFVNKSGEEMIPKAVAAKAFEKFKKDAETAFVLFKEDSKNAFQLFQKDSKKAFELYAADLQDEYSENMIRGLQDLYNDVCDRAQKDFLESKDMATFTQLKKIMTPLIAAEDQQTLLKEIEKLKSEKQQVLEEIKKLTREGIINSLVKDFPKEYVEDIREYLNVAKDEDDIYERFSFICEMIDKGQLKPSAISEEKRGGTPASIKFKKKSVNGEKKLETKKALTTTKVKDKKAIVEELNAVTSSVISKSKEVKVENPKKKYFTEEDEAIIATVFSG